MGKENRTPVLTGGCQCGAVRYALYVAPQNTHLCHCRMCQKAVGGPFAAFTGVALEDFAWTRGTPGTFESSALALRDFCRDCGTPLTFRYRHKGNINVTLGSLDRPQEVPPKVHYGAESRLPWLDGLDALPASTTEEDIPAEVRAKLVNYQHPDHDTPDDWKTRVGPRG